MNNQTYTFNFFHRLIFFGFKYSYTNYEQQKYDLDH